VRDYIRSEIIHRHGAYLPHWTIEGGTYHVVFRLADSLPAHVVEVFRSEKEQLRARLDAGQLDSAAYETELRRRFSHQVEAILDRGLGECWLRQSAVAGVVLGALKYFRGKRYGLPAASVMPNHVHAVVTPLGHHSLPEIMNSWKGYTARMANRVLGRSGQFWQPEYYDHLVRDEADLARTIEYVLANPHTAGLRDWPWIWAETGIR
jgi:REP element-mobilizing transposase RayT